MHALQPLTLDPSPNRTDASHELLRTLPLHVKVRVCACAEPFETWKTVAAPLWLTSVLASPPPLLMSNPPWLSVLAPENAVLELAVMPVMCACPSQPLTSEERA